MLSQKILEKYKFPYLSIDHLKKGLIRSKNTALCPTDSNLKLTEYLWPIVCEIIKTAIENNQNLTVEGCYVPLDYKKYFTDEYLKNIKFVCLIMSEKYINRSFDKITEYANLIENRLGDGCTKQSLIEDNAEYLNRCQKFKTDYVLIDDGYNIDIDL